MLPSARAASGQCIDPNVIVLSNERLSQPSRPALGSTPTPMHSQTCSASSRTGRVGLAPGMPQAPGRPGSNHAPDASARQRYHDAGAGEPSAKLATGSSAAFPSARHTTPSRPLPGKRSGSGPRASATAHSGAAR